MKYERLVEIYVKPALRAEIKQMKKELTYDAFLRQLIKRGVPSVQNTRHKTKPPAKVNVS